MQVVNIERKQTPTSFCIVNILPVENQDAISK